MTADRSVTIRLKVSSAEFDAAMSKAGVEVRILAAEIDAAGKNAGGAGTGLEKLGRQAKQSTDTGIKPLADAIVMLGPALVPIAAGALTLGAGLVGLGATGVLAFKGIQAQMTQGTALGQKYSAGLSLIKSDLSRLEATAAKGALSGFEQAVADSHRLLPTLNKDVGMLSTTLGDIAAHTLQGVIGGFHTFEPLIQHVSLYVDQLSQRFAAFATGANGAKFSQTLGSEFDQVIPVIENLVAATVKLVAAFAPVGNTVVGVIGSLTSAINAIPLPVLEALASTFVALYSANRIKTIFDGLSGSLRNMALNADGSEKSLGKVQTRLSGMSGLVSKAGAYGAVAVGIYSVVSAVNKYIERNDSEVKALANSTAAQESFRTALIASKGAIDASVRSSISYQLDQDGLTKKALAAGISQEQLTAAITSTKGSYVDASGNIRNYQGSLNDLIDTWQKTGKPSNQTIKALQEVSLEYLATKAATDKYLATQMAMASSQPNVWGSLATTANSAKTVGDMYHLTAVQVEKYAAMLGISKDDVANGVVTNGRLAAAVKTVATAYSSASATGNTFLTAFEAFSASGATAADRATLIGATLKAANGDLLSYTSSIAATTTATKSLTDAFASEATQVTKGTMKFKDTEKASIDLKTGLIDATQLGAGPLTTQLQALQDAAVGAATATYLHEKATKGGTKAADDAFKVYVTQTKGSLISQAKELGLTSDQATRLADQYFGIKNAGDIKKKIEQEGGGPVLTVLTSIQGILEILAGLKPRPEVSLLGADRAAAQADAIQSKLSALDGFHANATIDTYYTDHVTGRPVQDPKTGQYVTPGKADGGTISGPGTGTSDTAGIFALSNGEEVTPAAQASKHRALLKMIAADRVPFGMAAGGTVGPKTTLGYQYNGIYYGTQRAAVNAQTKATTAASQSSLDIANHNGIVDALIKGIDNKTQLGVSAMRRLSQAMDKAFELNGVLAQLATVKQQAGSLRNTISSSLLGAVGINQFGVGANNPTGYIAGVGNIISGFNAQTAKNSQFSGLESSLAHKGLNKQYLADLEAQGLDSLPTLQALNAASKSQLTQANKAYTNYRNSASAAANTGANAVYGPQIAALTKESTALRKDLQAFTNSATALSRRPIVLQLNGKEIYRSNLAEAQKAARR